MYVKQYRTIPAFFKENLSFLETAEAANNLLIGIPFALLNKGNHGQSILLLAVFHTHINKPTPFPLLSCIQTPSQRMLVYGQKNCPWEAFQVLIRCLKQKNISLLGVNAPTTIATHFTQNWCKIHQTSRKIIFQQMVYRLDVLLPMQYANGYFRKATKADMALLTDWTYAFLEEALEKGTMKQAAQFVKSKIDSQTIYVWDNHGVVSMASASRPTRHGITINYVYTPPNQRGKGYASSCVHQLSASLLQRYQFCSLITDLSNPIANRIYQRMGYQAVQEFHVIDFV